MNPGNTVMLMTTVESRKIVDSCRFESTVDRFNVGTFPRTEISLS